MHSSTKNKYGLAIAVAIIGIVLAAFHLASKTPSVTVEPTEPQADAGDGNSVRIMIENFVFDPAEVTVAPGTRVIWVNRDEAPHTATSTENKFNSGGMDTGDKYSFVFNDAGDYPYFCSLHPHMRGQIKVR